MPIARAAAADWDPALCLMSFPEARWDWVQPRSACDSNNNCTWDLRNVNFVNSTTGVPPQNPATYICDNQKHPLDGGEDFGTYYACACGARPVYNDDAGIRFQYPWQADFGKQCNLALERSAKGNYTGTTPTEGVCLQVAGSHGNIAQIYPDQAAIYGANTELVMDGQALAYMCNAQPHDSRLCDCDKALPETAFGRPLTNRDPCGLGNGKKAAGVIAGSTIGSIAVVALVAITVFAVLRRKQRQRQRRAASCGPIELHSVLRLDSTPPSSATPSSEGSPPSVALSSGSNGSSLDSNGLSGGNASAESDVTTPEGSVDLAPGPSKPIPAYL